MSSTDQMVQAARSGKNHAYGVIEGVHGLRDFLRGDCRARRISILDWQEE